jgi:hypothetical protein
MLSLSFSAACGDKSSPSVGSAAAPSASASGALADGPKKGTARLDYDKASAVYKGISDLKNRDPQTKKVAEMKTKLGVPDKTEGEKAIWYAVDKDGGCYEFSAGPDGSGFQMTDKAACGL